MNNKTLFIIGALALIFIAIISFTLGNEANKQVPLQTKTEANPQEGLSITDEQLKEKIGQMIMIGFRGTEAPENSDISEIIKDVKIGGVVLFDYDVPSSSYPRNIISPEQTKKLIADVQKYSEIPLFVAVDAEGGNVNRLKEKYGFSPVVSAQSMGKDKTLATVRAESYKLASELKNAGFNMNLAPVVDVNVNSKNPIIGALGRSFSSSPDEVFKDAEIFITNHSVKNIITVEKHFPGQGSSFEDSHVGMVDITDTYKQSELEPYKKLNDHDLLSAVMVGHVINKNIDNDYPATMSPAFINGILRKEISFNGVVISDDMQMAAITKNYALEDVIVRFINAGGDIISVLNNSSSGYDPQLAYKVQDIILNAVKNGKIDVKRIEESYNRIISLKKKFSLIASTPEEIKAEPFKLLGSNVPITFGNVLDIAENVSKKTVIRPAFLLAVSQEELNLEKSDLCYLTNLKTGGGIRLIDGKELGRVMNPTRDIPDFLNITKELKMDPLKTLVTCPMSFGWGGAMGPLDFIPSTWMRYKDKIEKINARAADPWNTEDAFLAAGLYLSDSGAKTKTRSGEWNAAMVYFSGSTESPYTWYADGTMELADKIQTKIDKLNK